MLNPDQRQRLLQIARDAIAAAFDRRHLEIDEAALDAGLRRPAGAFVTLNGKGGELRGCIGSVFAVAPLWQSVAENAVNAAFRDPRFVPLTREELPQLHLEISVMGPIERVHDVDDIEPGRDGLIIRRGHNAGLLLPQVATEYGWDRLTFLAHTCQKAGLHPDAWQKEGTVIERFSAEVFGEG